MNKSILITAINGFNLFLKSVLVLFVNQQNDLLFQPASFYMLNQLQQGATGTIITPLLTFLCMKG